jgi:hypothetical protein
LRSRSRSRSRGGRRFLCGSRSAATPATPATPATAATRLRSRFLCGSRRGLLLRLGRPAAEEQGYRKRDKQQHYEGHQGQLDAYHAPPWKVSPPVSQTSSRLLCWASLLITRNHEELQGARNNAPLSPLSLLQTIRIR